MMQSVDNPFTLRHIDRGVQFDYSAKKNRWIEQRFEFNGHVIGNGWVADQPALW